MWKRWIDLAFASTPFLPAKARTPSFCRRVWLWVPACAGTNGERSQTSLPNNLPAGHASMKLDILKTLNTERAARRAVVIVTSEATGEQRVVKAADIARDPIADLIDKHIRSGKSGMEETAQGTVFLTVHVPPPRLVITGAVHISQALAPIAKLLGYDVTIVDPRTAFATIERFPEVKVIAEWPDTALPPLGIDRYTAFVALTHDPKIDDPALTHALARDCFYIGALGSKKTHARRLERLKSQGISDAALARIHSPIGLDISAVSPPEIAVAIMGEITARLREGAKAKRELVS